MDVEKSSPFELGQIYKQWKLVSNSFGKWLKTFYYYGYIPLIILLGQTTVQPSQRGLTFWISIVFPFIGGDAGEAK